MIDCAHCGLPVSTDHSDRHFREVQGWEQVREGGGANAIAMRKELGPWIHHWCMERYERQHGIQGGLFDG
jgi:hypothetical protein